MSPPVRARLYREDHDTNDGRRLIQTTWADEPLPLLRMPPVSDPAHGHSGAQIIGKVTDIQREDEGWITARLRAVTLGTRPCWDGMEVTDV